MSRKWLLILVLLLLSAPAASAADLTAVKETPNQEAQLEVKPVEANSALKSETVPPPEEIKNPVQNISQAERKLEISIAKSRISWNTWKFQPIGLNDANIYLWDFGDKTLSNDESPIHSFKRWGKYKVTLSGSDSTGLAGAAEELIAIGFWHIQNPWLQALLGLLTLCVLVLIFLIIFNRFPALRE